MLKSIVLSGGLMFYSIGLQAQQNPRHEELKDILSWTAYQAPGYTEPIGRQLTLLRTLLYEHSQEYFLHLVEQVDDIVSQRKEIARKYNKTHKNTTIKEVIRDESLNTLRVYDLQTQQYIALWTTPLQKVRQDSAEVAIGIRTCLDPKDMQTSNRRFVSFAKNECADVCSHTTNYHQNGRKQTYLELEKIEYVLSLYKQYLNN